MPQEPDAITATTRDGVPRKPSDFAVLFYVPCPDCGARLARPCRGTPCEGRHRAAREALGTAAAEGR